MKKIILIFCFFFTSSVFAQTGILIPSKSMINQNDKPEINIKASFAYPFEMTPIPLDKPKKFSVFYNGQETNLISSLKETKIINEKAWELNYKIESPGTYMFYMEQEPYFKEAEDCFIIHNTKTYIAALGDDSGWDNEFNFETEIIPLTKPFGLYAGNVFQGIVKINGNPVPFAEIKVEYYNENKKAKAPSELMISQTIKADENGLFTYSTPKSGWWGFSALFETELKLKKENEEKPVEISTAIWVKFENWIE